MSNSISLAESKQQKKGDIVCLVTKIGDLKSGTGANGDWTKKLITITDGDTTELLSAWNTDIQKFVLNHKYEITGVYWKDYNNNSYLNFGKYSKIKDLGVSVEPNQKVITDESTSQEYLQDKQKEISHFPHIPQLDAEIRIKVEQAAFLLLQINHTVSELVKQYEVQPNPAKIGQFTGIIFKTIFGGKELPEPNE